MGRIHRYEGEEVVVEFDLSRCIHTGDCTHALPTVFDVKRSGRWVRPNAAPADAVAKVCADCPTGALRCINKATGLALNAAPETNSVQVMPDGPLYVHARMTLNGEAVAAHRAAFCRCGKSRLMPYCDNSHREAGFTDSGDVALPMPSAATGNGQLAITCKPGAPLILEGPCTLLDATGASVCESGKAAMCRCGASSMKPYCDGSHQNIGFEQNE
ncbi:MAG TPA: CDGSH iron-sulfur domain-containing protein [Mariprofundaceae bacterium]|nr:CDGSH iron-sulfur domain-containing protein [Mariprofundaceae bacterium]